MKNERVWLTDWPIDDAEGYTDIPWPEIHAVVGSDLIEWINRRDHTQVQLILQRSSDCAQHSLWAEFYTAAARQEFALEFAK